MVENIIKSDSVTTTAIGKLFGDDGAYDGHDIFRCLGDNGILPYCIEVRKRMLKLDGKKKGTF